MVGAGAPVSTPAPPAVPGPTAAAEALAEELAGAAARAPLRSLLSAVRALLLLSTRAPPSAARARDLQRATRALHARLHLPGTFARSSGVAPSPPRRPLTAFCLQRTTRRRRAKRPRSR